MYILLYNIGAQQLNLCLENPELTGWYAKREAKRDATVVYFLLFSSRCSGFLGSIIVYRLIYNAINIII